MGRMMKKQILITVVLFVVIFLMRLPYIDNAPAESVDMWRQADTESIARNFINHRFNIFYPQFNYDGPLPNYIQLEFQITPYLIAILYKIFGYHYFLARLVPTVFFMISVYYLYKLIKKIYSVEMAWITIFVYSIIPLNIFYSRAIMPESAVLCFFNGAFYYFYKWYETENKSSLFLSGIFTAMAILQKTPAIFIGLAMLFMCIDKYRMNFLKKWELWAFAAIALATPYVYTKWAGSIAEFTFVSDIGFKHIIPKFLTSFYSREAINFYKLALPSGFTVLLLIFTAAGLFTLRNRKERPIIYLFIAVMLEVVFIVSVIKFKYYLILLTPIVAILSGKMIYIIFSRGKIGLILVIFILAFVTHSSIDLIKDDFNIQDSVVEFGKIVDKYTDEDDLIVIGTLDPTRLSISNRQGWRANIDLYDYIPKDIEGEVNYFIENGAKYFIVENDFIYNDDGSYIEYLENNFEKMEIEGKYKFYILN